MTSRCASGRSTAGRETTVTLPTPLNSVAVARDGEIVAGGADGRVFFVAPTGEVRGELDSGQVPIIGIALSADGALAAAAGIRGSVAIIDRGARTLARTLVGPGLPVWSAAFLPDNRTLVTGGTDRMIRRWNAVTGDHIGSVPMADNSDPLAALAATAAPRCSAPASPATRSRRTKATVPVRRWPASSAAGSRACPATIFHRR